MGMCLLAVPAAERGAARTPVARSTSTRERWRASATNGVPWRCACAEAVAGIRCLLRGTEARTSELTTGQLSVLNPTPAVASSSELRRTELSTAQLCVLSTTAKLGILSTTAKLGSTVLGTRELCSAELCVLSTAAKLGSTVLCTA